MDNVSLPTTLPIHPSPEQLRDMGFLNESSDESNDDERSEYEILSSSD